MSAVKILNRFFNRIATTGKKVSTISKLVNDPALSKSYFPEEARKTKLAIWWENFFWLAKNGEVNQYYYVYGQDKKSGLNGLEVLPYNEFRRIRNERNLKPNKNGYNYVCILRDKFIFTQFLTSLGFPTPKNVAILNQKQITWLSNMNSVPVDKLVEDKNMQVNGFCKKLAGILGEGAFPLRIEDGKLFIKEAEITLSQLKSRLDGQYLLQERIIQHPRMSQLHPNSVNTVRLITFNNKGKVDAFCAALRIGTKDRNVDNWASGGIVVGIDLETGKLHKEGLFKPGYGGRVEKHPNTGILLNGFEIPFFREGVELALQLHSYLYGIHSVGWDIAITPQGPVFIEGNDDWEGGIPMAIEKNFKTKFLKMFPHENNGVQI